METKSDQTKVIAPKKVIYIVEGATGEYSDHREWPVAAYYSEAKAREHVLLATARADEIKTENEDYWDIPDGSNQYDPDMQHAYTGTRYSYYSVEIRDELIIS